jgi:hypothetical protein
MLAIVAIVIVVGVGATLLYHQPQSARIMISLERAEWNTNSSHYTILLNGEVYSEGDIAPGDWEPVSIDIFFPYGSSEPVQEIITVSSTDHEPVQKSITVSPGGYYRIGFYV